MLKPYGMSYYDFLIAHNWWTRKARIAALEGDASLLRGYYIDAQTDHDEAAGSESAQATAAAANVHIGDNVHVGGSVRAGGKPVATNTASGGGH